MFKKVESFDDIVFANRNKAYGAYELRTRYSRRGSIALAFSLFILFVTVGAPLIAGMMNKPEFTGTIPTGGTIEISKIPDADIPEAPPIPAPPAPPVDAVVFKVPEVVDSLENPDLELISQGEAGEYANKPIIDTVRQVSEPKIVEPTFIEEKIEEQSTITEKPLFPGGEAALLAYVAKKTIYPEEAIRNEIEGTVYVRFAVMKSGRVERVQILKSGGDKILDDEALRVISALPEWIPGKIDGNPVNVWFIVPVKFKLIK